MHTFETVKLKFAGSTDLTPHLERINFSLEHQIFLNTIEYPIFKEPYRDYFINFQCELF